MISVNCHYGEENPANICYEYIRIFSNDQWTACTLSWTFVFSADKHTAYVSRGIFLFNTMRKEHCTCWMARERFSNDSIHGYNGTLHLGLEQGTVFILLHGGVCSGTQKCHIRAMDELAVTSLLANLSVQAFVSNKFSNNIFCD